MFRRDVFGRFDPDDFVTVAGTPSRRLLLKGLTASGLLLASGEALAQRIWTNPVFKADPFSLGVACGDPTANGFVIWTKLAPEPLAEHGGMPMRTLEVAWEVASDESFTQIVQHGTALARPELGHAVHVEIGGLEPERAYAYRFTCGGVRSAVGRGRTFPEAGASPQRMSFGVLGCQRYEDGFFTAFRHAAAENFDFVFHYGDYIYEYRTIRPGDRQLPVARVMPGEPDEIYALSDYRRRYALYKLDPDLQAAHASAPWLVSFDDHEVDNNWAGLVPEERGVPPEIFALRRAAAFQAWYEHMPLRRSAIPSGPNIQAYRRFRYGDLTDIAVLDTRQFRSAQTCGDGWQSHCIEALAPERTMMGAAQETWLTDGFRGPRARWTVLAQQVMMMRVDREPDPGATSLHMDKWDGAPAARRRLLDGLAEAGVANVVVLTGDIHQNWGGELKADFDDPASKSVGVEFVATSITSGGDGEPMTNGGRTRLKKNPHLRYFNNQRGYMRHTVTKERWQADYRVLDRVTAAGAPVSTAASFVVEAGTSALRPA
jgi:alkaline phosphatase D